MKRIAGFRAVHSTTRFLSESPTSHTIAWRASWVSRRVAKVSWTLCDRSFHKAP